MAKISTTQKQKENVSKINSKTISSTTKTKKPSTKKESNTKTVNVVNKKASTTKSANTKATSTKKEVPSKTASKPKAQPKTQQNTPATEKARKALYRVAYDKDDRVWTIKKDGAKRTIASFVTKDEALSRVKELADSQDLNYVVRKKDGKFQKK